MNRLLASATLAAALAFTAALSAAPVISEFMASNRQTLADSDGEFSDWIEIHNPDATPADLTGWHLTDNATRKTKWQFPAVSIPAGGYLVVFASDKNRAQAGAPLHTNFALSTDGEYLGLIAADGVTTVSEFAPAFPSQNPDVAYGLSSIGSVAYLQAPTPGAANSAASASTLSLQAEDGSTSTFTTSLPVLVIDSAGRGALEQSHGEIEGTVQLVSGGTTFASAAGIKVRGSSSAEFPKKSYSLELHDAAGENRSASLLGMAKVADWALVSSWKFDPSHLRNAYLYALSNSIGRWAPKTRFTEVFFKGDSAPLGTAHYYGVGVLTERIKIHQDLIPLQSLSSADVSGESVTGGYILKIDPPDSDEFGWVTDRGIPEGVDGDTKVVVVSPKAAKLADEQRDYIRGYVQGFEDALFADRDGGWATRDYLDYIDRPSWVDFHLLQVFSKNPDGLGRSVYFTKDSGGKLKAGPVWDFDRAMGSTDPRSTAWDEWYDRSDGTPLWSTGWWGVLAQDPDYMQAWIDRWQSLRRGAFSTERLTALARNLAAQVDPAAAARDSQRWPDNEVRLHRHRDEVDLLVSWLTNRASWIDHQFIPAPIAANITSGTQISTLPGLMIAYTLDGSDPRASGGKPSASALLVGDTFILPVGVTATVRIYNPGENLPEIGSAWSSSVVVTGAVATSPSSEPSMAQLAAVSTRAVVSHGATFSTGFVVTGSESKTFVVRAVGRTLESLGVADVLLDPALTVRASDGSVVTTSTDWLASPDIGSLSQQFSAVGAFPLLDSAGTGRDAATSVTLPPGSYSIEVGSESGGTGVVLVEAYAATVASQVKYFSARGALAAGESYYTAFGLAGSESRTLLIRAIGGSADATLELLSGTQTLGTNNNWSYAPDAADIASAALAAGVAPLPTGSRDAALLIRLGPGTYTVRAAASVTSADGVQVEIIELP